MVKFHMRVSVGSRAILSSTTIKLISFSVSPGRIVSRGKMLGAQPPSSKVCVCVGGGGGGGG